MTFLEAGEHKLISIDDVLYITKAMSKALYIVVFKSQGISVGIGNDQDKQLYLSPAEYKSFRENLYLHAQKQTNPKV